jgi:sec-independent protein translocase protein TatA
LGLPELLIIAFIVILIFGVGRLPEVGGAVGKSIKEFRKSTKDEGDDDAPVAQSAEPAAATASAGAAAGTAAAPAPEQPAPVASQSAAAAGDVRFCSECGARNARSANFCESCGKAMTAGAR